MRKEQDKSIVMDLSYTELDTIVNAFIFWRSLSTNSMPPPPIVSGLAMADSNGVIVELCLKIKNTIEYDKAFPKR